MKKQNCWEYHSCGRQEGGINVKKYGLCPASKDSTMSGVNGGQNGGRICWIYQGTRCAKEVEGPFVNKMIKCMNCGFYQRVVQEEGENFVKTNEAIQKYRRRALHP